MILFLSLLFFTVENLSPLRKKCNLEEKIYDTQVKLQDKNYKDFCRLCECRFNGNWDCQLYTTCKNLNCVNPKFGEIDCCKVLKCNSNSFFNLDTNFTKINFGYFLLMFCVFVGVVIIVGAGGCILLSLF